MTPAQRPAARLSAPVTRRPGPGTRHAQVDPARRYL